ncbi:MAG: hypothetical protein JF608_08275 [Sphingomonadales bacterium]|nr:hypothetical protein [Sphingomonadales bacterium]
MTDHAIAPQRRGGIGAAIAAIGRTIWESYRRGGKAITIIPALLAIAVIPEFAQHAAEIHLGMFTNGDAFRAHGNDPLRWAFGYVKVAGFLIAILMTARFWAVGSVKRALMIPPMTLLRLIAAIVVSGILAWPFSWLGRQGLPIAVNLPFQAVSLVIQIGTLLPAALIVTLLVVLTFAPAQGIHLANHKLAFGRPAAVVWALMTFDALWIGFFAALVGSALFVGYRTGLTWRGWTVHPAELAGDPSPSDR